MTKECPNCQEVFVTYWPVVCCSMGCRDEYGKRNRREIRKCVACGEDFECKISSPQKLCGRDCIGEHNRTVKTGAKYVEREAVVCKNPGCGRTFERRITDTTWEFCGKSCRGKFVWAEQNLATKMIHKKYLVRLQRGEGLIVRSRWEAAFIKDFLEKKSLKWTYESKTFYLPNGSTYTPDFIIDDDLIVELKGHEYGPSLEKVKTMRSMGHSVVYADARVLEGVYGLDLSDKHLRTVSEVVA